jgi:hypothetical protein
VIAAGAKLFACVDADEEDVIVCENKSSSLSPSLTDDERDELEDFLLMNDDMRFAVEENELFPDLTNEEGKLT